MAAGQVEAFERQHDVVRDQQARPLSGVDNTGAQRIVPGTQVFKRGRQRRNVKRAFQPDGFGFVVEGLALVE